jgi:hypothetical protein
MSGTPKTEFTTTPDTHASENGHWNNVSIKGPTHWNGTKYIGGDTWLLIEFQNGPVKECGVNGVQLPDVLRACLARYKMLNKSFPCRENSLVITKLQEALMWDDERTARRTIQGVEGHDKPHVEE